MHAFFSVECTSCTITSFVAIGSSFHTIILMKIMSLTHLLLCHVLLGSINILFGKRYYKSTTVFGISQYSILILLVQLSTDNCVQILYISCLIVMEYKFRQHYYPCIIIPTVDTASFESNTGIKLIP